MIPSRLRSLACDVRTAAERAFGHECARTPRGYHNLRGYCGLLSTFLANEADDLGIHLDLVQGRVGRIHAFHFWCCYENRVVIDLTATQFWNVPRIYVVPADHRRYQWVDDAGDPGRFNNWKFHDHDVTQRALRAHYAALDRHRLTPRTPRVSAA